MGYSKSQLIVLPIAFLIMLGITLTLYFALRNKSRMIKDIPFFVIAVLLFGGEIAKQIVGLVQGYDFWYIPLHFCSTYFFWFALAEFSRGKFRKRMQNVAFVATLYLCVGFYVYPTGIFGSTCDNIFKDFFSAHTFFFHHLVILYAMLSIAFKRFEPDKKDAWLWMGCFATYFLVALTFAYALDTNYFNILESVIPPVEEFRLFAGQIPYTLLLFSVTVFMGAIFIRVFIKIREKFFSKKSKA